MKKYYTSVNLLRGIAAFIVCIFHFFTFQYQDKGIFPTDNLFGEIVSLGAYGVFMFFVISGFVIPLSLFRRNYKLKDFRPYILRRFVRLQIPYIASIILILAIGVLFALKNNTEIDINPSRFFYHLIYFIPFTEHEWYNVIYWTLAIEFQFYIFIGLIFYFVNHKKHWVVLLFIILFGASNFLVSDNRVIFNYSILFIQGIIIVLLQRNEINKQILYLLLGLAIISTGFLFSISIAIISGATAILIQFLNTNSRHLNQLGDISYSLYLTHGAIGLNILYLFSRYFDSYIAQFILIIIALVSSLLFARLFWRLFEKPSIKLSKKIK